LVLAAGPAAAEEEAGEPTRVTVDVAGATYLKMGDRISRVSIAASEIADIAAFPPDQVLITGKQVGITSATIWYGDTNVETLRVEVTFPLGEIRAALRQVLPTGKNLDVRQSGGAILISGEAASAADVARAEAIARGFMNVADADTRIVNLLTVAGDQQVQIEVAFAEVSRSSLREIGLNFWSRKSNWAGGLVAPTSSLETVSPQLSSATAGVGELNHLDVDAIPLLSAPLNGTFGAIFSSAIGDFPFSAALSILSNRGYARVLAEPTLVALSGKSASFLAGGEFPIPLPQGLGQIAVDFKKFGIQLAFTPTVVGDTIQLAVAVTVSDIDQQLGVRLESVTVPGLTSRHAESTIRMKDGQSFVIAGLLSDRVRSSLDKVPWLGDMPILGALFRSTSYRRDETELLVVVTAHRVRPLGERPELPGEDARVDPSDLELFLLGRAESLEDEDDSPRGETENKGEEAPEAGHGPQSTRVVPAGAVGFKR
jgi:pilus assembly protein CpaC